MCFILARSSYTDCFGKVETLLKGSKWTTSGKPSRLTRRAVFASGSSFVLTSSAQVTVCPTPSFPSPYSLTTFTSWNILKVQLKLHLLNLSCGMIVFRTDTGIMSEYHIRVFTSPHLWHQSDGCDWVKLCLCYAVGLLLFHRDFLLRSQRL